MWKRPRNLEVAGRRSGTVPYVFGYGSLMWDPFFPHRGRVRGRLRGYHRAVVMAFPRVWGRPDAPCPVLGLEPGGTCEGVVYEITPDREDEIRRRLAAFEGPNFTLKDLPVTTREGEVEAVVAVNRRDVEAYIGDRSEGERARMVARSSGESGSCLSYLRRTADALADLGVEDAGLRAFLERVEREVG